MLLLDWGHLLPSKIESVLDLAAASPLAEEVLGDHLLDAVSELLLLDLDQVVFGLDCVVVFLRHNQYFGFYLALAVLAIVLVVFFWVFCIFLFLPEHDLVGVD